MTNPIPIRCSSLPLVAACAASIDAEFPVDSPSPEAQLGTAVHDFLAAHIGGWLDASYVQPDLGDDYRMLTAAGLHCWKQLAQHFPAPSVERFLSAPLDGIELTGHADVLSVEYQATDGLGEVRVLDWKTGREDFNHDDQLKGYGLLGLEAHPDAESVSVALCRVRYQTVDLGHFTRAELRDWWQGIAGRVLRERRAFNPGRHCGYCPRGLTCPAKTALLRQAVGGLTITDDDYTQALDVTDPDVLSMLYDRAKLIERAAAAAIDQIRASVIAAGGRIATSDGRELVLTEQTRRSIDVAAGIETLNDAIGWDAVAPLLKIGKGDVEKAVMERHPRGKKTQAVKELLGRLESDGALRTETVCKLEVRRNVNANPAPAIEAIASSDATA